LALPSLPFNIDDPVRESWGRQQPTTLGRRLYLEANDLTYLEKATTAGTRLEKKDNHIRRE